MRRKNSWVLILSVLLFLGGCVNRSDSVKNDKNIETTEFPDIYEKISGKVIFQTRIKMPENVNMEELYESTVTLKLPDQKKVKEYFAKDWETKGYKEVFDEKGSNGEPDYYHVLTTDHYGLSIRKGVSYNTPNYYFYNNTLKYDERDNLTPEYFEAEGLKNFDVQECLEQAKEVISDIGYPVENLETKTAFLPCTLLEEKENWVDNAGNIITEYYKDSWTQEDDACLFLMHQNYQGLPVYHNWVLGDNKDANAPIQVLWSRRGLEELNIAYYFEFKTTGETHLLKNFDVIAETVEEKFNEILSESTYTVTDATLYQMVKSGEERQKYTVEPVWILDITETLEKQSYSFEMLVDAVTGKEVIE